MKSPEMGPRPEKKEIEPTEVLKNLVRLGEVLEKSATDVLAMIEEAKERGIPIDLSRSQTLKGFVPWEGQSEAALNHLISKVRIIYNELFDQGVKVTKEDLEARVKKMEQPE